MASDATTIAALAYDLWVQRGCPVGSPEEDWFRAEEELKERRAVPRLFGTRTLPNAVRELN